MDSNNYFQQITDIKDIIEKNTKFKALSGLSAILAGIYALIGVVIAKLLINRSESIIYLDLKNLEFSSQLYKIILIALLVFISSLITGIYFSEKNAKKHNSKLWTPVAKRVFLNFSVPMFIGAIFCIAVILKGYIDLISPICLLFYGLSLLNISYFTFSETKILGYSILFVGCLALFFVGFGLYLWALGFGVFHIVYGIYIHIKYEK